MRRISEFTNSDYNVMNVLAEKFDFSWNLSTEQINEISKSLFGHIPSETLLKAISKKIEGKHHEIPLPILTESIKLTKFLTFGLQESIYHGGSELSYKAIQFLESLLNEDRLGDLRNDPITISNLAQIFTLPHKSNECLWNELTNQIEDIPRIDLPIIAAIFENLFVSCELPFANTFFEKFEKRIMKEIAEFRIGELATLLSVFVEAGKGSIDMFMEFDRRFGFAAEHIPPTEIPNILILFARSGNLRQKLLLKFQSIVISNIDEFDDDEFVKLLYSYSERVTIEYELRAALLRRMKCIQDLTSERALLILNSLPKLKEEKDISMAASSKLVSFIESDRSELKDQILIAGLGYEGTFPGTIPTIFDKVEVAIKGTKNKEALYYYCITINQNFKEVPESLQYALEKRVEEAVEFGGRDCSIVLLTLKTPNHQKILEKIFKEGK